MGRVAVAIALSGGASCALAAAACDGLIGLEPPTIAAHDAGAPHDATADRAVRDASAGPDVLADSPTDSAGDAAADGADAPSGPVVLAPAAGAVALATDATYVYWLDATHGWVMRCPIAGCPSGGPAVFFGMTGYDPGSGWGVGGIAAQSDSIYVAFNQTSNGMLLQCPSSGCASPMYIVKTTTGSGGIFGVTTDSTFVYYANAAGLNQYPLNGGRPPLLLVPNLVAAHMGAIAVADGRAYFASTVPPQPVGECSTAGCMGMPVLLTNTGSQGPAIGVAANASAAYWTTGPTDGIVTSPWPSGPTSVLANVKLPQAIVADDQAVYFGSTQAGGAIYSCAPTGCGSGPTLVADNLGNIGALAIDASRIYAIVAPAGQMNEVIEMAR
jgi:hypothetical protein